MNQAETFTDDESVKDLAARFVDFVANVVYMNTGDYDQSIDLDLEGREFSYTAGQTPSYHLTTGAHAQEDGIEEMTIVTDKQDLDANIKSISYKPLGATDSKSIKLDEPYSIPASMLRLIYPANQDGVKRRGNTRYEKAHRLLELKQQLPALAKVIPPMFLVPNEIYPPDDFINYGIDRLKEQLPEYFPNADGHKLIVRSCHKKEGSAKVPLSGVFESIPNVEMNLEAIKQAQETIQDKDYALQEFNSRQKSHADPVYADVGHLIMPQVRVKYFMTVEPVVYAEHQLAGSMRRDVDAYSKTPFPKTEIGGRKLEYEVKIYGSQNGEPHKLLKRNTLAGLTTESLEGSGVNISQEQIADMKRVHQQVSDFYSDEYQEMEFVVGEEAYGNDENHNLHLVQTRDQGAWEKPDEDETVKLYKKTTVDSGEPEGLFTLVDDPDQDLPLLVIDERQLLADGESIDVMPLEDMQKRVENAAALMKDRIQNELGFGPFILAVQDLSLTAKINNPKEVIDNQVISNIGSWLDVINTASLVIENRNGSLANATSFHSARPRKGYSKAMIKLFFPMSHLDETIMDRFTGQYIKILDKEVLSLRSFVNTYNKIMDGCRSPEGFKVRERVR
ncbi:MAG: hypothetical protein HOA17_04485 [Candidatus Melainabacteria bacterium]|nr:hypothetical protein [Candidatus Melainabacteria bacterium]